MPVILWGIIGLGLLAIVLVQKAGAAAAICVDPCCDPTAALPTTEDQGDTEAFLDTCLIPGDTIAAAAQQAGFSGNDLVTAVAIALAESGGNPNAYNPETAAGTPEGQGSYGLWQIYLKAHPEFAATDLFDPDQNANAAFFVYNNAGGFSPWSTYKNGAYLAQMSDAQQRVNS